MLWEDRLNLLRWRAVEDTDAEGALLPMVMRSEATRAASDDATFLHSRCSWLKQHINSPLAEALAKLHVPALGAWAYGGWIVSFVIGYALTELGSERLINVLALPLMSLLLWNAVMIVWSLLLEWKATSTKVGLPAWLRRWVLRGDHSAKGVARFHALVDPLLAARVASRSRAWLHVGAAVLALGTISGMYAKGWSREYRAVWESTLLTQETAARLLSALYKPASATFGVAVPVDRLVEMRAGPGRSPVPADALPWIHLYAGTLFLLVLLPRLALASLTLWRGQQRMDLAWNAMDWPLYEARLKSAIAGTGIVVSVLTHGWRDGEEPRERWTTALRDRFGALAMFTFDSIHAGDEEEFPKRWQPTSTRAVIVFNAATTPELEVQSTVVRELHARMKEQETAAQMSVLLDASSLRDRRSPEAVETRLDLWRSMLKGWADEVIVC